VGVFHSERHGARADNRDTAFWRVHPSKGLASGPATVTPSRRDAPARARNAATPPSASVRLTPEALAGRDALTNYGIIP